MRIFNRHSFKNQRGAAVVEFALVVPLLLLVLFGIIEFSVLLYDKAMLTNASREGARAGIVYVPGRAATATTAEATADVTAIKANIESAVKSYCESNLISFRDGSEVIVATASGDVDSNGKKWESGDSLEVSVTYDFNFMAFSGLVKLFGGNLNKVFNLKAVTEMRLE